MFAEEKKGNKRKTHVWALPVTHGQPKEVQGVRTDVMTGDKPRPFDLLTAGRRKAEFDTCMSGVQSHAVTEFQSFGEEEENNRFLSSLFVRVPTDENLSSPLLSVFF